MKLLDNDNSKYEISGKIYLSKFETPKFNGELNIKEKVFGKITNFIPYSKLLGEISKTKNSIAMNFKNPRILPGKLFDKLELHQTNWLEDKVEITGKYLGTIYLHETKPKQNPLKIYVPEQRAVSAEIRKL